SVGSGAAGRRVSAIGDAGARPTGTDSFDDHRAVVTAVQREVLPYDKNYLRRGDILASSLVALDSIWTDVRQSLRGEGEELVRSRQAAAMTAHARWMYRTALARNETRGMAKRLDYPDQDPAQQYRLTTGGLDDIWVRPEHAVLAGVAS
ncbi:MAG TPA: pyridine nucleotide-disulfide oxidoreductase, partial [Mycobacterium sp.]|nr:pyridine nucleotide-disulfide oxidoreductase [Mycobacterium sp.]